MARLLHTLYWVKPYTIVISAGTHSQGFFTEIPSWRITSNMQRVNTDDFWGAPVAVGMRAIAKTNFSACQQHPYSINLCSLYVNPMWTVDGKDLNSVMIGTCYKFARLWSVYVFVVDNRHNSFIIAETIILCCYHFTIHNSNITDTCGMRQIHVNNWWRYSMTANLWIMSEQ